MVCSSIEREWITETEKEKGRYSIKISLFKETFWVIVFLLLSHFTVGSPDQLNHNADQTVEKI